MLDFHSHLIPAVDDGAQTLDDSRRAVAAMQAQGIRTIITTPHLRASLLADRPKVANEYLAEVDESWDVLQSMVADEFPGMQIFRGVELMLDAPFADLSDPRVRLNGTKFVLVEFSFGGIPPNSSNTLFQLKMAGHQPIVAHPERYRDVASDMSLVEGWRNVGAGIQVNAGSFVGKYGDRAQKLAWELLYYGMADYMSSDYHARGEPLVTAARTVIEEASGAPQFELLTTVNPNRIVQNKLPVPVPPLERPVTGWRKWFGRR